MAMAGLIQQQTKQAINGLPGLSTLPVLGSLFRSRDFINNQTELMVMVTPYIVRAVAPKDLSRPDDGFAAAADPQADLLGSINRIYGVPGRSEPSQELSRHLRLYHRLRRDKDETMTTRIPVDRNRALRMAGALVGLAGLTVMLGACTHTADQVATASIPEDYRLRHPIAVQEANQSVVILVGHARGGLSADQRADVMGLAQTWRHDGPPVPITADVPIDTSNARCGRGRIPRSPGAA